ncbi:DUF2280 domain-containing protein [Sinorhizobium meliloti]|uniref:DUF2280 domain-containing protein n=1 Tax=Rhizobium meliloti TaxID=382 RepID=UPI00191489C9|nr:DUF2280 domain-containing protein [Sinorhizobium meliloti]UIJ93010.1 DUF2280 domain-containing protein [Sinorhizobium meliloti]WKL29626.1 DUF2280 domain-containing protein [Sinorhizobium meliloti]WKL35206.1 DUF2280 domain-containing protein [Sinorhizobium meliloti]WKL40204.1 DUF2280 domain-containing protein [Sinorhizobium meliloti]
MQSGWIRRTITHQSVEGYHPTKKAAATRQRSGRCCSKTRKTFLEDTATIAISDRAVRLRALQRKAENRARCRGVIA